MHLMKWKNRGNGGEMANYQVHIDYRSRNGSNTYISIRVENVNSESEARQRACSQINGQILKVKIYKER